MKIIEVMLKDIKPYEKNPRKNDDAVKYVAESIKQFGFKVPIVLDKDNIIVAGHTRYKAAKNLKLDKVPCLIADDLTEEQIKAYRLADNKVAEKSEWDFDLLGEELEGLLDFDMSVFGFEIDMEEEAEIEEDEVPEVDEENEPITQRGDIWKLGDHYLMCGDATDKNDIEALMTVGESP
jgi:site-specific DNA-methyltransferase (adenine-specific)